VLSADMGRTPFQFCLIAYAEGRKKTKRNKEDKIIYLDGDDVRVRTWYIQSINIVKEYTPRSPAPSTEMCEDFNFSKLVTNEKQGESGRWQIIDIGLRPWGKMTFSLYIWPPFWNNFISLSAQSSPINIHRPAEYDDMGGWMVVWVAEYDGMGGWTVIWGG
jgi:hypothetical protein